MGKRRPPRRVAGSRSRSLKATEVGFEPGGRALRTPRPSHHTQERFLPRGLALLVFRPAGQTPHLQASLLWNFPEASRAIRRAKHPFGSARRGRATPAPSDFGPISLPLRIRSSLSGTVYLFVLLWELRPLLKRKSYGRGTSFFPDTHVSDT